MSLAFFALAGCGVSEPRSQTPTVSENDKKETEDKESEDDSNETEDEASTSIEALASSPSYVLSNVQVSSGERVHLFVKDGKIAALEGEAERELTGAEAVIDASDYFLFPGFIDSHVHLTYLPQADALARAGILGVVDLAAPLTSLQSPPTDLHVVAAGPMITSVMGYPTQSWGRDGYGLEVAGEEAAQKAVQDLLLAGAKIIKIPLDGTGSLTDEEVAKVVEEAHKAGVKVAVHALTEEAAARAAAQGCDVLAHTPTEELTDETVTAWGTRAVISTLRAFGDGATARSNLRRLQEAGATILYGTDFGNSRVIGIDVQELAALEDTGLTRTQVLASGTSTAAMYFGLATGLLVEGGEANFLLLNENPELSLDALSEPAHVFFQGRLLGD